MDTVRRGGHAYLRVRMMVRTVVGVCLGETGQGGGGARVQGCPQGVEPGEPEVQAEQAGFIPLEGGGAWEG